MYEAAKYEAARVDDTIYHTAAFWGFIAGAVLGLALCALMVFVPCGFLVGLLIGAVASKLPEIGKKLGRKKKTPSGKIITGSPNVHINKKAAAFSGIKTEEFESRGSYVDCTEHPRSPPPQIAEGSKIVFITGQPAARKDDRTECDATINEGSPNVHVGMEKQQYMPIDPEVARWMEITAQVLMLVVGLAGAIRGLTKLGISGLKAMAPCLGKVAAGMVAGYVLGQVLDKGLDHAIDGLLGEPVDTKKGRKVILPEIDFVVPDVMPIIWSRFYASDLTADSALGQGWRLPWEQTLHKENDLIYLTDKQGRKEPFPTIKAGERIYLSSEKKFLICTKGNHYVIQTLDNEFYYFGELFEGQQAPLLRIENSLGHFIHFTYEADRVTDISSTGGHRLHLHYGHPKGRLTEVVRVVDCEAVETLVSYRYDTNGQLTSVINRNGDAVRYFNYDKGLMISHQNGLGFKSEYRWQVINNEPRVVEHWTSDGEHYHINYDIENRITKMTDALQREAEIHYNEGYITTYYKDFGGNEYHLELDQNDNITDIKLPGGGEVSLKYDELSRLIEETDQLGRKFSYSYYKDTELKTETVFPDGATWKAAYDEKGTLLFETNPTGSITQYYNTEDGLPYAIVDALGKRKEIVWNKLAQVERYIDCSEKVTQYHYNNHLHLSALTNALGETTRLERKPAGEIVSLTHADGIKEAFTYNAMGQLLSHADGKGQMTYLSRNPRGLLTKRYDPKDQTIIYQYDVAQRLTTLLNENNEAYRFSYDKNDRLVQETHIDQINKQFTYDETGYLQSVIETSIDNQHKTADRTTLFERDKLGRLLTKTNQDAHYIYDYDMGDRITQIERVPTAQGKEFGVTEEVLNFTYDIKGRITQEQSSQGTLDYFYDELGNLTALTLPDDRQLNYQYYGSGHLHQISLNDLIISDFERDNLHREILRTQGNLISRFGYDAQGRKHWQYASRKPLEELTTLNTAHLLPLDRQLKSRDNAIYRQYQYGPAGELSALLDKTRGKTEYSYAENGQLQTVKTPNIQEYFTSDVVGNFLPSQTLPNQKFALHNRITDYGDIHLEYDKWGNVAEKSIGLTKHQQFTYDCENRLVKAQTYDNGKLIIESFYQYDGFGRRVKKQIKDLLIKEKQQTTFLWQGLRLLQEQNEQKQITYTYEPNSYIPLARIDQLNNEQEIYYYHNDQIGTPLELTNQQGIIVWQANYKVWGEIESFRINEIEQNLRYQGQYFDEETELHYNTFRYYDSQVGRFTTQDPIGLMGGINLYAYAPNPLVYIDPLGLSDNPLVGLDLANMTKKQISDALSNASNISWKGGSPDGTFAQWKYTDTGTTAVRLDPPDKVTLYDHAHLYDKAGNSLDINGNVVDSKSPAAHNKTGC